MILLYARLRLQVLRNLFLKSGIPPALVTVIAAAGFITAVQFAVLLGDTIAQAHEASPGTFAFSLSALFLSFQLVFTFVVLGSVSIRLFDPRKVAEVDTFSALPLRRADRFLIQVSEVAVVPVSMITFSIVPGMLIGGYRADFGPLATATLAIAGAAAAFLPVPVVIAVTAFLLRATPAWLFRQRALLFAVLALGIAPVVPALTTLLDAWRAGTPASRAFPATWAANAAGAAISGDFARLALELGVTLVLLALACAACYLAYDRTFLERFDEVLAKLAIPPIPEDADAVSGRRRRTGLFSRLVASSDPAHSALLRKEVLGFSRDPALQFTFFALGASALAFALLAGRALGSLAAGGIAFLAVYMSASLGLASFSQEGRGLPVLAPLPLEVDEVLTAKLRVNTAILALAGAGGGALVMFSVTPWAGAGLLLAVPAAVLGAIAAAPLGALVTAMGALFPRRLLRTGRREISIPAMSFFSALAMLFYASVAGSFAGAGLFGRSFVWMPLVVLTAWTFVAAALVSAARKAIRRGRWEG